jgi:XTP/dITP diphosphohydrolase
MSEISENARKAGDAFAQLIAIVETLRDPGGCPWDADQTHVSLRQYLLEESYELLDAIDSEDSDGIEEEIGDILTQVAFQADIAHREGRFDAASACLRVIEKLIQRHPHVFVDGERLENPEDVVERWDQLKRDESGRTSIVASLPPSLPALALAGSVQRRAIKAGLPAAAQGNLPVFVPKTGETDEKAEDRAGALLMQAAREIGDAGIDPEIALHAAAVDLRSRVLRAEKLAGGIPLADLDEVTRSRLWNESATH